MATVASFRHNTLWAQKQYWIQTNMAPVVGIIVFLPLIGTIVTQVIWRFRSSEFTYCWVPRMPVYARWIAVDGWRTLCVFGIIAAYIYIVCAIYRARKYKNNAFAVGSNDMGLPPTKQRPAAVTMLRHTAIDSEPSSKATNDGRGLFSQSIHNIQYWALSKLGRNNNVSGAPAGLRAKIDTAAVSNIHGPVYDTVDYYTICAQHIAQSRQQQQQQNMVESYTTDTSNTSKRGDSLSFSSGKPSRDYYEQFKRSFVHNIIRWFTITTDIPSPTISESIFDNICKYNEPEHIMSSTTTHCDICSSIASITANGQNSNSITNIYCRDSSHFGCQSIGNRQNSLRRWYSTIARLITKPTQHAVKQTTANFSQNHRLRRSHTAPVLSRQDMGLCNCIFKRPQFPTTTTVDNSYDIVELSSETALSPSQQKTLPTTYKCPKKPGPIHHAQIHQVQRSCSIKERTNAIRSESITSIELPDKIQKIFGHALHEYKEHTVPQPHRVSIYACANYNTSSTSNDSDYSDESAQIFNINGVEKFSSLEEGNWAAIVGSCRSDRKAACQNRQFLENEHWNDMKAYRISRLFVYPLAYVIVWLPSIVYYIISTYVYYTAFESSNPVVSHNKRSVDMSSLPAHWTLGQNANRAWPYYRHASSDVWGSNQLYWLAIIQALHLLNGAIDALLFWITETRC
ncbi:hypothetical protein COEREDRAFT_10001 [Coemansia reversa NRRL 1564]|uniref:Uncharacterized protein n=1 Tax=Coemansia reversa (strain ATCC 12441 / NRRL 1564) TaxID=763665 RepID=A0A2G5B7P9_COERN|nr:hypothetical protein COEREDRAFT_10001 [Coemansia reversa NRRL 1564]|eukprot:PIA14747.1 hypothetical protein COEREDRAFT_10001 [Coemansia reversa NRRL 1564]